MKVAFIIYNQMTALDFIGIYDPLTRLKTMNFMPDFSWDICGLTKDIFDGAGLQFTADTVAQPLSDYDMIIIPGAFNIDLSLNDPTFIEWLQSAQSVNYKVSVCTGSALLGAAGFLKGKKATTHPAYFNNLKLFCDNVLDQRIVEDNNIITAQGVTSAIDLGLYLVEKIAGENARIMIAKQMDYPHYNY